MNELNYAIVVNRSPLESILDGLPIVFFFFAIFLIGLFQYLYYTKVKISQATRDELDRKAFGFGQGLQYDPAFGKLMSIVGLIMMLLTLGLLAGFPGSKIALPAKSTIESK